MEDWKLMVEIEKIINRNCKEIPYEGTSVDKTQLKEDIFNLIKHIDK